MTNEVDMNPTVDPADFAEDVRRIRAAAEKLRDMSTDFPAVNRNVLRILASVKMIELNLGAADEARLDSVSPPAGRAEKEGS